MERAIAESVRDKVLEAIERTTHLVSLVPVDRLDWTPSFPSATAPAQHLGLLLGHLLDCLAGFCAVFEKALPAQAAALQMLAGIQVNRSCSPAQAQRAIRTFAEHIERGFADTTDADLSRRIPTVFVPQGETLITLLLGNLEHLNNHKYQLFVYLKLAGVAVASQDLYRFRGG